MMEVDKAVTQTAPDAESRLDPTPTREQTALGRRFTAMQWKHWKMCCRGLEAFIVDQAVKI